MTRRFQPRIRILLSTYNGMRFLEAQLLSLLDQDYPRLEIRIRDDGSTDGTAERLDGFRLAHPRTDIAIARGPNLGVVGSYLSLLAQPALPDTWFAFCDQDDVWLPEKLERAVAALARSGDPERALYCSAVRYVDADLRPIGESAPPRYLDLANAVVENRVVGCTALLGPALRRRMLEARADDMLMHDWWAYLVASAFGQVMFDPCPTVLYRQHGTNVSGWERTEIARLTGRARELAARRSLGNPGLRSLRQARAFLDTYRAELSPEQCRLVAELAEIRDRPWRRLGYALAPRVHRSRRIDDAVLRLLIALGRY